MKFVPPAMSRSVGRSMLRAEKSSPTILFGVGVLGMVGATVLACRATLKLQEVVDKTNHDITEVNTQLEHREFTSKDEAAKEKAVIFGRHFFDIAKLYAPSVVLGAASIGCLTKSHNILNRRNAALTAAYVAIEQAFLEYRSRVVEKYGPEQDQEFRYATEEVELIDSRGKIHIERRVAPGEPSMYARFFDEYSASWSSDPEYNLVFLRCQQNWANDMLKVRGHMFLNEVYDSLGLKRTTAGSVVGWVISKDGGDNQIDFGIYTGSGEGIRNFVNGREGSILLDFNVDGIIYDQIDTHKERIGWQK